MPKSLGTDEVEKILCAFDDSDLSDLSDIDLPNESNVLDEILEACESPSKGPNENAVAENILYEERNLQDIEEDLAAADSIQNYRKINTFSWTKTSFIAPEVQFTETYPKITLKTPLEYFMSYFTEDFVQTIRNATNQSSLWKHGASINAKKEEILNLIALEIITGTIGYPRLDMYWSKATAIPSFRQSMTRNRFHQLRNNLKFATDTNSNDKLHKIRPLLQMFYKKIHTIPKDEHLCVDEMMVPFKGKTAMRQYMPKKPIKWGIKIFCLCSSKGIIYDFETYQGKNTIVGDANLGFCSDIVVHLTRTIPDNKNFKLYFDNYFTTINLINILQQKRIWATGTIRGNRIGKAPLASEKELQKSGRGTFDFQVESTTNIFILRWLDGGIVQLASSIYGESECSNVARYCTQQKKKIEITQPNIVAMYNKNMGGVDKVDFLLSLYRITIRSKKWTLKMFDHFIDMAICNSWLEYRIDCDNVKLKKKDQMDLLAFRNDIADGLLAFSSTTETPFSRKRGRPKITENGDKLSSPVIGKCRTNYEVAPSVSLRYDGFHHWPEYTPEKQRCKVSKCTAYARYMCAKCKVHLCIPNPSRNCFTDYHKQ